MTTIGDAERFLARTPGFHRTMTRGERRNAARLLYRQKRPPKMDPEKMRQDRDAAQARAEHAMEQMMRLQEMERQAEAELMRTQKTRSGPTFSLSEG